MLQINRVLFILVLVSALMFFSAVGWCQNTAPSDSVSDERVVESKPEAGSQRSSSRVKVGDSFIYRLMWKDQFVGYSKFFVDKKMSLAGETFFNIDSLCQLKIGLGRVENLTFASQMTVKEGALEPNYFQCIQKIGNTTLEVHCLLSANLIAQKNVSPVSSGDIIISLESGEEPYFFMKNLWGRTNTLMEHYWILLKSGRQGKIFAYDPVLQHKGYLELEKIGPAQIQIQDKSYNATHFILHDFSRSRRIELWADGNQRILRMSEPGGLTAEITQMSGNKIISLLEESPGVDLWQDRVSLSNIFIPNASKIDWMKINIDFVGRGLELEPIDVPGFSQTFAGEMTPEGVRGQIEVRTGSPEISDPLDFPVTADFPGDVLPYTRPSMGIESDNQHIMNRALEASWKAENMWDAAVKVNRWVNENISRGIALPSAKMTLANEQGNSESRALLAIAMCRALDFPARRAGGLVFSGGSFVPHYWMEVYTGQGGWVPLDPDNRQVENLGATHIRLFGEGEVWDLNVEVMDFNPKPPDRVTYINRELSWPVGEERVYVLKSDGKKVGTETAWMKDVSVLDNQESYRIIMESTLDLGVDIATSKGEYWMNPQGLPIRFEKEVQLGGRTESHSFTNQGEYLVEDVTRDQKSETLRIPFSRGAYLADTHFLSQWVIIAGQFDDLSIGRSYNFTVFIPETYSFDTMTAQVRQFESVEAGERIYEAFRVETNRGLAFWVDQKTRRVVKLSFVNQKVDMELLSTELKI